MSKIFSRLSRSLVGFSLCLALAACAAAPPTPSPSPPSEPAVLKQDQAPPVQDNGSRAMASLRLTEQARVLLESGKVDEAITTLERAMNVNPSNGQNYYYLAEAWLRKGNSSQAREFNRLAALYLRDEPGWMSRVLEQGERIRTR